MRFCQERKHPEEGRMGENTDWRVGCILFAATVAVIVWTLSGFLGLWG